MLQSLLRAESSSGSCLPPFMVTARWTYSVRGQLEEFKCSSAPHSAFSTPLVHCFDSRLIWDLTCQRYRCWHTDRLMVTHNSGSGSSTSTQKVVTGHGCSNGIATALQFGCGYTACKASKPRWEATGMLSFPTSYHDRFYARIMQSACKLLRRRHLHACTRWGGSAHCSCSWRARWHDCTCTCTGL